jgi:hypothetical protein
LIRSMIVMIGLTMTALNAANAAGPSTPEDWQKMYEACVIGTMPMLSLKNLNANLICGCIKDEMRKLPPDQFDNTHFHVAMNACLKSTWPDTVLESMKKQCAAKISKDLAENNPSAAEVESFCDCTIRLTARAMSWEEYLQTDAAIKARSSLDQKQKAAVTKWKEIADYCAAKAIK